MSTPCSETTCDEIDGTFELETIFHIPSQLIQHKDPSLSPRLQQYKNPFQKRPRKVSRMIQIRLGKSKPEYMAFTRIKKFYGYKRTKQIYRRIPVTPNYENMQLSVRSFLQLVRMWRKDLHRFDCLVTRQDQLDAARKYQKFFGPEGPYGGIQSTHFTEKPS